MSRQQFQTAFSEFKSPVWHKKVLATRLGKIKAGKGEFLTINQLKKRLGRPRSPL